jgi:hypothetical protein
LKRRSSAVVLAMLCDEASFEDVFDDLQQFEKRSKQNVVSRKTLVIC